LFFLITRPAFGLQARLRSALLRGKIRESLFFPVTVCVFRYAERRTFSTPLEFSYSSVGRFKRYFPALWCCVVLLSLLEIRGFLVFSVARASYIKLFSHFQRLGMYEDFLVISVLPIPGFFSQTLLATDWISFLRKSIVPLPHRPIVKISPASRSSHASVTMVPRVIES